MKYICLFRAFLEKLYLCERNTVKGKYMEIQQLKRCPVGIQTFSEIIENNYVYVDKTEHVYRLVHSDGKYFFLSRPRRFGKSLLTSTLRCYFEGRRDLFKGLAIDRLETEWAESP